MNKYFILILFSVNTFAQEMNPTFLVEQIDNKYLTVQKNICSEDNETEQNKIKACVRAMCGAADPEKSIFITGEKLEQLYDKEIEDQFQKDLPELTDKVEKNLDFAQKMLDEMKNRVSKLDYSPQEKGELIFDELLPHLDILYMKDTKELAMDHDQYQKLSKTEQKFFDRFKEEIKLNAKSNWEIKYKLGLPLTIDEIVSEAEKLKSYIEDKKDTDSELAQTSQFLDQIKNAAKSAYEPSEKFIHTFATYIQNMRPQLNTFIPENEKLNLCDKIKCDKFFDSHILPKQKSKITNFEEYLNKIKKKTPESLAQNCKSTYYYDDIESEFLFKKYSFVDNGVERVLKHLEGKYSKETTKKFKEYVQNGLKIETGNKNLWNQSYVEQQKFYANQELGWKEKMLPELSQKSDYELTTTFNNHFRFGSPFFSQMQFLCKGDMNDSMMVIDDHFNPYFNFLKLSHHTCNHPESGQDVFAHELGHVFSELISKHTSSKHSRNKFEAQRNCVSRQYLIPDYDGQFAKLHYLDHFRSEEDMADYFSAQVSLTNKSEGKELGLSYCTLLPVQNDDYGTIHMENVSYDNHSATFIRLLREAHYKGKEFPRECKSIIQENKHLWKFSDC